MNTKLNNKASVEEKALLKHCKLFSSEYINNLNKNRAPHATTYSHEFCEGAADLIRLYQNNKIDEVAYVLLFQGNACLCVFLRKSKSMFILIISLYYQ